MAPGALITSTYLNNQFQSMAGTSMATPVVAGAAVLLHQALDSMGQSANAYQDYMLGVFKSTGKTVVDGDDENDNVTNTGLSFKRLDLAAALSSLQAANQTPTISGLQNQALNVNGSSSQSFTVGDAETPAGSLQVLVSSSDTSLVPPGQIVLGGSGANRTISITPAANQSGSATITVSVRDAQGATTSSSFLVTVSSPATLPFTDSFTQADGSALNASWQAQVGGFAVQGGVLKPSSSGLNLMSLNGVAASDYSVQADVNLRTGTWGGLVLRYAGSGDTNFYFVNWFSYAGRYYVGMWRSLGGVATGLGQSEITLGSGRLRVDAVGSAFRVYVNGVSVLSASDTSLVSGTVGLLSGAGIEVDNFSAAAIQNNLPFSDTFTLPTGAKLSAPWHVWAGNLVVQGSALTTDQPSLHLATVDGVAQADLSVQADFNVLSDQWAGLVTRYSGPNDYYFANWFNNAGKYYVGIWRVMNGTSTGLGQSQVQTGSGRLRLDAVGSSLRAYVNNENVLSVTDGALSAGSAGIGGGAQVVIDNFSVDVFRSELPFSDSFAAPGQATLDNNWQVLNGQFSAQNGTLTAQAAGLNLAVLSDVSERGVSVQANFNLAGGSWGGLVTRHSGPGDNNMYFANWFAYNGHNYVGLSRNVNGV
jgi:hypothetical protein